MDFAIACVLVRMNPPWLAAYALLGAGVGFLAGLLGVGGGAVMVPVLTSLFAAQGFPREHLMHMALGTSMAAIVVTSISSLRAHHRHGAVRWEIVRAIAPGILLGTLGGTFLSSHVSNVPLAIFFVLFTAVIAYRMLRDVPPQPTRGLPGALGLLAVGLGIGFVSALVAIGGGSLSVPFMTRCNVLMRVAVGTSAAIGLPISLAGALGYLFNGWDVSGLPPQSLGFVYWPALLSIGAVSVLTAPLGARLAHRMPVDALKRVFAGLLLVLSAKMLHTLL